jgi:hypothetical protein
MVQRTRVLSSMSDTTPQTTPRQPGFETLGYRLLSNNTRILPGMVPLLRQQGVRNRRIRTVGFNDSTGVQNSRIQIVEHQEWYVDPVNMNDSSGIRNPNAAAQQQKWYTNSVPINVSSGVQPYRQQIGRQRIAWQWSHRGILAI